MSREHNYQVDARVRPLLFWIRKSNVGDGRITWRTGPDGTVGYELLVGTNPARTPRRINRWGYLREESAPLGGTVFGVMSQSDEQSIEDADRNTGRAGEAGHTFKALHQQVTGSEARVTLSNVRVGKDLTYADLGMLLAALPEAPSRVEGRADCRLDLAGLSRRDRHPARGRTRRGRPDVEVSASGAGLSLQRPAL